MTGYERRAATMADVPAIHELVAACERELFGQVRTDADRIAADLGRAGLDPAQDTLLVFAGATLVARAWADRRSEADVHPGHRGRGLGTQLLEWIEQRARTRVSQTVPGEDTAAVALLRSRGWTPMVESWQLGIDLPGLPEVPEPPAGVTVRCFRGGDELATYELIQDAFDEWQQRRPPYAEWAAHTIGRSVFAPGLSPLAWHGDQLVGAALTTADAMVDELGVHRGFRRRGLARLLLRHTFRAAYEQGLRSCSLWTHSDTGALAVYQRVGMSVQRTATVFVMPPGRPG
ncbi:GNAT family N-acetyltransferase [Actinoplanes sp. N902-109]|uniref:GNAT family N-acetyltransferase n=1 Tax=Actinoplanes sp. (strain N902-109) TaxID=649831 RepID=UPI0003A5D99C|nr:GNAT family N-acetyltransferase [Actinoplanes sp. N902-109]